MNILFFGEGRDAAEMLSWTKKQGVTIVGVSGDESVKVTADRLGIPFYYLDEMYQHIESFNTDLAISFLYGKILKAPIIHSVKYGTINYHPAPLPDYKGRAGCSFAIIDKLNEWGCTAHYIDEGIDTGDIIAVKRFPFKWREETGASLKHKTVQVLCCLYKDMMKDALHGKLVFDRVIQKHMEGKYISKKDMLAAMEVKPGDDIDAKIQAFWFPPYEGAYTFINGKKYMLINDFVLNEIANERQGK